MRYSTLQVPLSDTQWRGQGYAGHAERHLGVKGPRLPRAGLQDVWHLVNGGSHKDACNAGPLKTLREAKRVLYASVHRSPFFVAPFNQHCAKAHGGSPGLTAEKSDPSSVCFCPGCVLKAGLLQPPRQWREIKPSRGCLCILGSPENLPPTRSNFLPPSRAQGPVYYQRPVSRAPTGCLRPED